MWFPATQRRIEASISAELLAKIPPEVDAMYAHQMATSRRPLLDAPMARPAGDYDAETLEALRAFLADLAWSDQGE